MEAVSLSVLLLLRASCSSGAFHERRRLHVMEPEHRNVGQVGGEPSEKQSLCTSVNCVLAQLLR